MTPRQAVDRLRGFCDDRERRARTHGALAVLTLDEVRGVIDEVEWPPEGLVITEADAGILLALLEGRPVTSGDLEALTGKLAVLDAESRA